jgi:hypothetical protein
VFSEAKFKILVHIHSLLETAKEFSKQFSQVLDNPKACGTKIVLPKGRKLDSDGGVIIFKILLVQFLIFHQRQM